ncbi:unnamed protein product [Dracunculus medinensis]|uniref:V-SNARE coiled-coil homology domain-containing protein n=1 Tax=Dracunculus medinensis TaxID=318479 RepID=A0A0N4UEV3_DRAME|nr:unnamed protein product [Dracunculus medinensis]
MVTPPNQSIDYVVDQIERLGGRINDLVLKVKERVDQLTVMGDATAANLTRTIEKTYNDANAILVLL